MGLSLRPWRWRWDRGRIRCNQSVWPSTRSITSLTADLHARFPINAPWTGSDCPPLPSFLSMTTPSHPLLAPKAKPLAYSPVLHPIPSRAVEKIRSGAYLDFKDLLVDNIALLERLQELGQAMVLHGSSPGSVKLRSISDPLTWVFCFLSFMAASSDCISTRNMAAYAQIVILQSRKHPGGGWLGYDQLFRQHREAGVDLPWNDLAPSIMASTVLRSADTCNLCHFPDHATEQCALFSGSAKGASRHSTSCAPTRPARFKPYVAQPSSASGSSEEVCRRFNKGTCPFSASSCPYSHTCGSCNASGHCANRCPERKEEPKGKGRAQPPIGSKSA